ncbi:hypothetical protein TNCV_3724181 [Trichonephila clavipes]|nr:hypothetical protein TNCV_3724181 [Trichonephila clavipes]
MHVKSVEARSPPVGVMWRRCATSGVVPVLLSKLRIAFQCDIHSFLQWLPCGYGILPNSCSYSSTTKHPPYSDYLVVFDFDGV